MKSIRLIIIFVFTGFVKKKFDKSISFEKVETFLFCVDAITVLRSVL